MTVPLQLTITRPGGEPALFDIEPGVYTIGSDDDCKISLNRPEIEGRHAILTVGEKNAWLEDLQSEHGTRIDGEPCSGRQALLPGQEITIGQFTLVLSSPAAAEPLPSPSPIPATPAADTPAAGNSASSTVSRSIKDQIHKELLARMDLKRLAASRIERSELEQRARATIRDIVEEVRPRLPPGIGPAALVKEIFEEALGLGPIEDFLADPDVTEIMVNGPDHIYVEKEGKLILTDRTFINDTSVLTVIERIVSPLGRRIDESQPYVDARLPDGSRVNAIIHPLSLVGPCLTIRKFAQTPFTGQDLTRLGTWTDDMARFAQLCVLLRKNIIVSGGTGSGKTTLLNVLSSYLPESERIVTIEDAAELRLKQDHIVRLEARPPNIEGRGAITIRDLVRNALRMRPDRIVVGECRGGEALDMLQAMNTGHDGSLTTVHANSPRDVISRMETMVLMSGMELPTRAIREQVASAVDLIVHESRYSDGTRKVNRITEVIGLEGDQITMQDIFAFEQTGVSEEGRVIGAFAPVGAIPTFVEEIQSRGLSIDRSMFDPLKNRGKE